MQPIDYRDMLDHIALARGLAVPHDAAVDEMQRSLAKFPAAAVRAAVREWLSTDTWGKLPLPGQLLPLVQSQARMIAATERAAGWPDDTDKCPECTGARMVLVDEGTNRWRPCARCNTAAFSRWKRGHFEQKHEAGACGECRSVRENKAIPSAIASLIYEERGAA